jgi:integrase
LAVFHERITNGRGMATFRRLPSGLWQVQIFRRGVRKSESFPSKGAAVAWAGRQEAEIMGGVRGEIPNLTVRELFERYDREVSAGKKGQRWESIRLGRVGASTLGAVRLRQLDTPNVSAWQQERLKAVSGASVRRERNLLNNVFNVAVNEWHWLTKNPFKGVRRPKDGKPRTRIATPAEITRLERHASKAMRRVIVWAVETGMRAGEIAALRDVKGRVAHLYDSKTGEGREVPLSAKALEVWQEGGFGISAASISALFARYCDDLEIEGLTFHDLRATACTRLSKKIDALQLAKMLGHKNPKMLMVYYRESAADIAKLL